MSDEQPKPWYVEYKQLIVWIVATITMTIAGAIGGWQFAPLPPPIIVDSPADKPTPVMAAPAEYAPVGGWVLDPDEIAANLDPAKTLQFNQTPAGRAALGDDDVFLWQAVRKVRNKGPPDYPNINQGPVGCCVGAGFKHASDVVQATAILSGKPYEWKPVSVEVIYAGSRVQVGGGKISGDGSVGAWAAKWVRERGGIVAMEKYPTVDLSTYSPTRARSWGKTGVPADLEKLAKEHPVKGAALVTSWVDVKRAISQGYPVAVCSDQGFTMTRDATGRCKAQGAWAHCMCIMGVRAAKDGRGEGGFILNSWGDAAHTGPVWPADAPVAGFWADATTIDRMVRQGDSFALADVAGFPGRKVPDDWFIRGRDRGRRLDPFLEAVAIAIARSPTRSITPD